MHTYTSPYELTNLRRNFKVLLYIINIVKRLRIVKFEIIYYYIRIQKSYDFYLYKIYTFFFLNDLNSNDLFNIKGYVNRCFNLRDIKEILS